MSTGTRLGFPVTVNFLELPFVESNCDVITMQVICSHTPSPTFVDEQMNKKTMSTYVLASTGMYTAWIK